MPTKLHPPRFYAELTGQAIDTIIMAIHARELRASDLRRPAGRRPRWYIAEHDWQQFLDSRSNQQAEPVVNHKPVQARQWV